MDPKLKELLDLIKERTTTRDTAIAGKDYAAAKNLNIEIKGLQDSFDVVKESTSLKAWGDLPANQIPSPGSSGKDIGMGNFGVSGWQRDGHADLEFDRFGSLKAVEQVGGGTFGEEKWKALKDNNYMRSFIRYVRGGERSLGATDLKDLSLGLDPQGGYLAPAEFIARIIARKPTPTRLAGMVSTINTSRDAIELPKVNYSADDLYTTGFRVTWTGETAPTDTTAKVDDSNLFGTYRIEVHQAMLSSYVTLNMLEDNAFDIQGWLVSKFGETADLLYDNMILNGTGIAQPFGVLANPGGTVDDPAIVVSGNSSALTADGLVKLDYALPEQYINGNLAYCMNRTNTALAIAQMKDGQNRYLFNMGGASDGGLQGNRPDSLLGKPISYSGFAPNIAANAYPIIYGDWTGYARVNRLGLTVQILYETGAKRAVREIVGRLRFGGKVLEPFKLKVQKIST